MSVAPVEAHVWRVEVACHDRLGLLATISGALTDAGLSVQDAPIAMWGDGGAVDSSRAVVTDGPTSMTTPRPGRHCARSAASTLPRSCTRSPSDSRAPPSMCTPRRCEPSMVGRSTGSNSPIATDAR